MPMLRQWLADHSPRASILVEPFSGGAAASLMAANENLVDEAHFAELDEDVAATWQSVLNGRATWLADQIREFKIGRRRSRPN